MSNTPDLLVLTGEAELARRTADTLAAGIPALEAKHEQAKGSVAEIKTSLDAHRAEAKAAERRATDAETALAEAYAAADPANTAAVAGTATGSGAA